MNRYVPSLRVLAIGFSFACAGASLDCATTQQSTIRNILVSLLQDASKVDLQVAGMVGVPIEVASLSRSAQILKNCRPSLPLRLILETDLNNPRHLLMWGLGCAAAVTAVVLIVRAIINRMVDARIEQRAQKQSQ